MLELLTPKEKKTVKMLLNLRRLSKSHAKNPGTEHGAIHEAIEKAHNEAYALAMSTAIREFAELKGY